MTSTPAGVPASLREQHRKLTRPRQAVLDILTQVNQHLTPSQVYRKAKLKYPRLGLTTVYRTLDLLVELGYLQRVHLEAGCHSYAIAESAHGHHLVCSTCGRSEVFSECEIDSMVKTMQTKTGYRIDQHMLELMGLCPSCQKKEKERRK